MVCGSMCGGVGVGSVRGVCETVGCVEERERLWGVWRGGCGGVWRG